MDMHIAQGRHAFGLRRTKFPMPEWPQLLDLAQSARTRQRWDMVRQTFSEKRFRGLTEEDNEGGFDRRCSRKATEHRATEAATGGYGLSIEPQTQGLRRVVSLFGKARAYMPTEKGTACSWVYRFFP
jgi:hypothetical protein